MDTQVVIANEGASLVTHSKIFPPRKCSLKIFKDDTIVFFFIFVSVVNKFNKLHRNNMLNNLVRMLFASPYLLGLFVKLQVFIWYKFEVFLFFFLLPIWSPVWYVISTSLTSKTLLLVWYTGYVLYVFIVWLNLF